jgi:hypothetical protein
MAEIRRIDKNREQPAVQGEGDVFIIPLDVLPKNLNSGEKVKLIIEGTLNITQEEGVMQVDKIYPENASRTDPLQDSIEKGLDIELKINQ